jgi:cleavage and polyadenylation specificity factor subunit 4
MYRLGFCVYGPLCRYKHTRLSGPPPDPETLEAAKPKEARDINVVVNMVNKGITDRDRQRERERQQRCAP